MYDIKELEIQSRNQLIENLSNIYMGTYTFEQSGADIIYYPSEYEGEVEVAIELDQYYTAHFEQFMVDWKETLAKDINEYGLGLMLFQDICAQDQVILLYAILGTPTFN